MRNPLRATLECAAVVSDAILPPMLIATPPTEGREPGLIEQLASAIAKVGPDQAARKRRPGDGVGEFMRFPKNRGRTFDHKGPA